MKAMLARITAAAMILVVGLVASIQAGAAGEIVAERAYFTSKGPWLLWNKDKCLFEETDDHPEVYSGVLRKVDADELSKIVFTSIM